MENAILIYLLKVSVSIGLFYSIYMLWLRNDTFNQIKRFYLLFAIVFSLSFPFWNIHLSILDETAISNVYQTWLPEIEITNDTKQTGSLNPKYIPNILNLLSYILCTGTVLLAIKLIIQICSILRLRYRNKCHKIDDHEIIDLPKNFAPFSFFKWIFIPLNTYAPEDKLTIITHEKVHTSQYHSIDNLIGELFCIFFWWNPVTWLLKKEMRVNLEYIADESVLKEGFEPKKYQYLLLQITNQNTSIQIVNNFNVSQLKKRIIMLNKQKSKSLKTAKYLFIVPIALVLISVNTSKVYSESTITLENIISSDTPEITENKSYIPVPEVDMDAQKKDKKEKYTMRNGVYTATGKMPQFPGGDIALMKYISSNLKYPESASANKIEGRVIVRFVVSETGQIRDVTILRSIDQACDAEAKRVVEAFPTWTPGMQDGVAVPVYYTLPILYKLKKDTTKK